VLREGMLLKVVQLEVLVILLVGSFSVKVRKSSGACA
jgi:hypothetical protein